MWWWLEFVPWPTLFTTFSTHSSFWKPPFLSFFFLHSRSLPFSLFFSLFSKSPEESQRGRMPSLRREEGVARSHDSESRASHDCVYRQQWLMMRSLIFALTALPLTSPWISRNSHFETLFSACSSVVGFLPLCRICLLFLNSVYLCSLTLCQTFLTQYTVARFLKRSQNAITESSCWIIKRHLRTIQFCMFLFVFIFIFIFSLWICLLYTVIITCLCFWKWILIIPN